MFLFDPEALSIAIMYYLAILHLSLYCPMFFVLHPNYSGFFFSLNTRHTCPSATVLHGFCRVGSPHSHLHCWAFLQGLSQISLTLQTLSWHFQPDSNSLSSELPKWHQLQYSLHLFLLTRPQTTFRQLTAVSPRFKHFVSLSASENLKKYFNLGDN